jgi:hypothetical protein
LYAADDASDHHYAPSDSNIDANLEFLVEAGAYLHQLHAPHLEKAREVISSLEIAESLREQLFHIVEQCRPNMISSQSSIAARIVFDADAGDLIGVSGLIREAMCNCGDRGLSFDAALQSAFDTQQLFFDSLQTPQAKRLYKNNMTAAQELRVRLIEEEGSITANAKSAGPSGIMALLMKAHRDEQLPIYTAIRSALKDHSLAIDSAPNEGNHTTQIAAAKAFWEALHNQEANYPPNARLAPLHVIRPAETLSMFSPLFWVDSLGEHPNDLRVVQPSDIRRRDLTPSADALNGWLGTADELKARILHAMDHPPQW